MDIEKAVAKHYTHGSLGETILAELQSVEVMTTDDIAHLDEFHIGGRAATVHLMDQMQFTKEMNVLDVGCGIGGAARFVAETYGAFVTGIDLTPEYCDVAEMLSMRLGLHECTRFEVASALSMPFKAGAFDAAYTIHAAMNIKDKADLYKEIHRVLKPGALFGIYDVLAGPEGEAGEMAFPVPWAATSQTSFLAGIEEMKSLLAAAGFYVLLTEERRDFGLAALEKLRNRAQASGGGPFVMGENFAMKIDNLIGNIERHFCAPWQMICRRQ